MMSIVLVAEKNLPREIFSVPWKKKTSHGDRDAQPQDRSNPNGKPFAGKFHRAQNQRKFGAFAHHHEEHESGQADSRGELGFRRVLFDVFFDFLFQMPRHAVHPDNHGDHKDGREQQQQPFEAVFADLPALQRDGHGQAGSNSSEDSSPHPARQIRAPGAVQIDEYDADDQGGFDTFTKSDEESREQKRSLSVPCR